MLILTSDGITSPALMEAATAAARGLDTAALIPTASPYKEKDWHVPAIAEQLETMGLRVTCLDIQAQDPQTLWAFDVIFLMGGNPYYLLDQLQRRNCAALFHGMAQEKLVMGASAGSLVLGRSIGIVQVFTPEMNEQVGLCDLNGLGISPVDIFPHYEKYQEKFEHLEERIAAYERETGLYLWRIRDGEGVFVSPLGIYQVPS